MSDVVHVISINADNGAGSSVTQVFQITVTSSVIPPPSPGHILLADGTSSLLQADGTSKVELNE